MKQFLPHCSIADSKIDISFVSPENPKVLLSFLELKKHMSEKAIIDQALLQTICYMVCPLAYCRWGRLRMKKSLKTLLVTPTCVYRLTISKPASSPFGLNMNIEETKDLVMMEWVLSEHVGRFMHECKTGVAQNAVSSLDVDFVHWTPFNISLGNIQRSALNREPNLGFIFKTTGEFLRMFKKTPAVSNFPDVESDRPIYVKYISALLDVNHQVAIDNIEIMLYKIERLSAGEKPTSAEKDRESPMSDVYPIKHPYLGILSLDAEHPLLIMNDMGQPLDGLLSDDSFRLKWKTSAAMRKAFFSDIGISALNLVDFASLCHNDIRPANIVVKYDSFCLIDFDMSRRYVVNQKRSVVFSPKIISSGWVKKEKMMFFTVAQIAVTVFILSADKKYTVENVSKSTIWNTERSRSYIDVSFQKWVYSKGPLVSEFIEAVRESGTTKVRTKTFPIDYKQHFVNVLDQMLA